MGHKVNPDIYRLGVSKTWTFQLRTNKNFIKNLFLFKFLRNLFMNYTIPFFDFKTRRNQKLNDKLILRGEDQLVSSPFVKNNLLFSHIYFGLVKNKLYIESFFIDVNFKQVKKRNENAKKNHYYDITEFKPWNSLFYKQVFLRNLFKRKKKSQNNLKKIFSNRIFKFLGKNSKVFKFKSVNRISKDFFFLLRNFKAKHNRKLVDFLKTNYKIFYKRFSKKEKKIRRKKRKYKPQVFVIKVLKTRKKKKKLNGYFDVLLYKLKQRKFLEKRNKNFIKDYDFLLNLDFMKKKIKRIYNRIRQKTGLRYLRKVMKFNPSIGLRYSYRYRLTDYKLVTLPKLLKLVSNSYFASLQALALKKTSPKNPLYLYDFALLNEKSYTFYSNYKNIKILKYFIRSLKLINVFPLKKKIFFCQNLISLLMNFFGLVNSTILTKKMYLLLQSLMFYSLSFSFFNFLNFKKHFFSRFVFFKGVSKTVYRSIIELTNEKKLSFNVIGQNKFRFNSSLVLNYILIKLGQYFTIHEIVNPLSFYIKNLTSISGYKILITGRLTRKERAAVMIRSGKRMPLSTIKANIDYSAGFKIMKFGLVGIKVYLLLNPSTLLNLYKFNYTYN